MFHVCDLPEVYCNYFIVNKSVHSTDTRQSNDLHIHYIKKSIGQRTVQYIGSILCNSVPPVLKNACQKSFKSKLKMYLLSKMVAN